MQTGRGGVLLVCADAESAYRLSALMNDADLVPVLTAESIPSALSILRMHAVRLVVSGAIMPGGDGSSLAQRIVGLPLLHYPDVLILCPVGMRLFDEAALAGYGGRILREPVTADDLRVAAALADDSRPLPPEKAERLEMLLDELGIPGHPGREMLINAVSLVWRDRACFENLKACVYPKAGRLLDKTGAQAERAIRHVIETAWQTGDMEAQSALFGSTIDARRGRPTCGAMIARLADILRREG